MFKSSFATLFVVFGVLHNVVCFAQDLDNVLIVNYEYLLTPKNSMGFAVRKQSTLKSNNVVFELHQKKSQAINGGFTSSIKDDKVIFTGYLRDRIIFSFGSTNGKFTDKVVKDVIPKFKWKITNETKTIGKYECRKATASFRGSQIVAYFTEEIPVSVGPYKFKGLPGLILEVVSTDGEHRWIANKVSYDEKDKHPLYSEFDFHNVISLREEIEEVYEQIKEIEKQNRARIANSAEESGATDVDFEMKTQRAGIEKIYEWELEESEKN